MKTLIPIFIIAVAGCATHAQPPIAKPVPPPPQEEDVLVLAQAPNAFPPSATAALADRQAGVVAGPRGNAVAWAGDAQFKFGLSGGSSSRRTLVIPKGEAGPELLGDAEEDLNVMSLILEKAADTRSEDEGKKALGIDIFSSSSGIRNLLIEGHGAIFVLKTKIALVPPPSPKKEEVKPKESTSSEWEDARRQLYGPSEIEKEISKAFKHVQANFTSSEEYDEKKVQRLKDSLIESLKSAANIRHLSGDQNVTVVVLSSSPVHDVRRIVTESGRGGSRRELDLYTKADRERAEGRSGARLMFQARKSDIDAFAKGKVNAEAFRDKVKVQIY